ncbi:MAG: glycoside hydrolase family 15 protein [Planctomycetota bacterium]
MSREIALGNGRLFAAFDADLALRELTFPHVGQENHTLGRAGGLAVVLDGENHWLDGGDWRIRLRPLGDEGRRARFLAASRSLEIELRGTIELDAARPVLRRTFRLRDLSPRRRRLGLLVRHDLALLESDLGNGVRFDPSRRVVMHYKRRRCVLLDVRDAIGDGVREWTLAREDDHGGLGSRGRARSDRLDGNPTAVGAGDSLIAIRRPEGDDGDLLARLTLIAGEEAAELDAELARERGADGLVLDPAVDDDWAPLDHAALERISRGVCAAHVDRDGAIMAGIDSEMIATARESYAYCWPRDGACIAETLEAAGRGDLAARFLAFAERVIGDEGFFEQRFHADGSPASSWHAWAGPDDPHRPIQADETALVVLAADAVVRGGTVAPERRRRIHERLVRPAARFLVAYRDPETRLPLPSHDLWEERSGVHLFTAVATERALVAASDLAETEGDAASAAEFARVAGELAARIPHHLFHREADRFARRAERTATGYHLDVTVDASLAAAALLAPPDSPYADELARSVRAVERELGTPAGGIARYQGDTYHRRDDLDPGIPGNPWIIGAAWVATWRARHARREADLAPVRRHLDWILARAGDSGALPEQIDAVTGADLSVKPLTWSHAEYLRARAALAEAEARLRG